MMFLSIGDDNDDTVMYEMPVYMVSVVKKCSISNQPNQLTRMCRAVKSDSYCHAGNWSEPIYIYGCIPLNIFKTDH